MQQLMKFSRMVPEGFLAPRTTLTVVIRGVARHDGLQKTSVRESPKRTVGNLVKHFTSGTFDRLDPRSHLQHYHNTKVSMFHLELITNPNEEFESDVYVTGKLPTSILDSSSY